MTIGGLRRTRSTKRGEPHVLSVVTLVRNRNEMLCDFLRGWSHQTLDDLEVIVVRAGGAQDPIDVTRRFGSLEVRNVALSHDLDDDRIAYSHARNAGAKAARGDRLLFCDADTIATPRVGQRIHDALDDVDALLTVDVRYLAPDADLAQPIEQLSGSARRHPRRPDPPDDESIDTTLRHELVWGLCMAMRTSTFEEVGGFDEDYVGYAGEDTDLARTVHGTGRPAGLVGGATVLHQHHDSFEPPLHQMSATLLNAERYRAKWGVWPMEGWLVGFEQLGLITRHDQRIEVHRLPTTDEIDAHRCRLAAPFRI